jgi:hypothetical protein
VRISPENATALYALVADNGLENTQFVLTGVTPGGEFKFARAQAAGPGWGFLPSFGTPFNPFGAPSYNGPRGYYRPSGHSRWWRSSSAMFFESRPAPVNLHHRITNVLPATRSWSWFTLEWAAGVSYSLKLLRDETRRIAANIAKLPKLLLTGGPARCGFETGTLLSETWTLLALYATIQALAVTTTTKAESNQPRVSISALRSGLLVSCKFAIETSIAQWNWESAHRLGAGTVNFSLARQLLLTHDEAREGIADWRAKQRTRFKASV